MEFPCMEIEYMKKCWNNIPTTKSNMNRERKKCRGFKNIFKNMRLKAFNFLSIQIYTNLNNNCLLIQMKIRKKA